MVEIEREGGVATLFLHRPKVNALSPEMVRAVARAWEELEADESVGAAVLASRLERTFCAGFDLRALDALAPADFEDFIEAFAGLYRALCLGRLPVVAAVGGHAVAGGAILALACDRRVFGEGAGRFGLTEVDLALPLPPGVVALLRSAAGEATAREACLFGRLYDPAEARAAGLADRVVPREAALEEAREEARALAAKPPEALAALRELLKARLRQDLSALDAGVGRAFGEWWQSSQARERRQALLQKLGGGR